MFSAPAMADTDSGARGGFLGRIEDKMMLPEVTAETRRDLIVILAAG